MSVETLKLCGILILLAPLIGAILAGALGRPVLRGNTHWIVIAGVAVAFAMSVVVFGVVRGAAAGAPAVHIPLYDCVTSG
ncbi:MAG: hypothetical protein IIB61_01335, partial [Planctomycetes bacterium]|nr:hypothetical protein [Planctomycetota bacterium]